MNIGLRQILLGIAVILFVIAVFSDTSWADLVAWGLAAFAAAFLVDELGVGNRLGNRR
jgi:predicted cobalt transporter CbtA